MPRIFSLSLFHRFLATGDPFHSLQFQFRVSVREVSEIIQQTLAALRKKLVSLFMPSLTPEDLEQKAKEFHHKYDFPNCCGEIDRKHIRIVCPNKSGSLFLQLQGFFSSTALLAVVDPNYKFMFSEVPTYEKEGDPGIFESSSLGRMLYYGTLLPPGCRPCAAPHFCR